MRYTFSSLNDRDLEELTRDLLSRELKKPLQAFKPGTDKGADLRYSTPLDDNQLVVQVKHYLKSGLSKLLRDLKKEEYPKIERLQPGRYLLVTSLSLNVNDKEKIRDALSPFIASLQDIYGQEDLNRMLVSSPEVETAHFKLWLSSTPVLTRILQNAVQGRSAFVRSTIEQKINLFVQNATYEQAIRVLNENNFLLITGDPGVGKSTLSDMLCFQLMAEDFDLIYTSKIKEAEDAILPEKKQVFYLDDFLGTITFALYQDANVDAHIVDFIKRVQADSTKRLILNCRTVILNQAKDVSERFQRARLELAQYEVVLGDYSPYHKARILYNHIYSSSLPELCKAEFTRDQFYWKIIQHKNYNPRIIEFLTSSSMMPENEDFQEKVLFFLDHPEEIWDKPYNQQLTFHARLLVRTLFSFGRPDVKPEQLKKAFKTAVLYEIDHHGYTKPHNLFVKAMKELEGAYISTTHIATQYGSRSEVRIVNPSLEDYLVYYYAEKGLDEYLDVIRSSVYTDQLSGRITTRHLDKKIQLDGENRALFWNHFTANRGNYLSLSGTAGWKELHLMTEMFEWAEINKYLLDFINEFTAPSVTWNDFDTIIALFKYIHETGHATSIVPEVNRYLMLLANSMVSHWQIPTFHKFIAGNQVFRDRMAEIQTGDPFLFGRLQQAIDNVWKVSFDQYLSHKGDINTILDKKHLEKMVAILIGEAKKTNEDIGFSPSPIFDEYTLDYAAQVAKNEKAIVTTSDTLKIIQDFSNQEPGDINLLFNSTGPDQGFSECPF